MNAKDRLWNQSYGFLAAQGLPHFTPTLFKSQLCNKKDEVGHLCSKSSSGQSAMTAELWNQWREGQWKRWWRPQETGALCIGVVQVRRPEREWGGVEGKKDKRKTHQHLLPLDISAPGSQAGTYTLSPPLVLKLLGRTATPWQAFLGLQLADCRLWNCPS